LLALYQLANLFEDLGFCVFVECNITEHDFFILDERRLVLNQSSPLDYLICSLLFQRAWVSGEQNAFVYYAGEIRSKTVETFRRSLLVWRFGVKLQHGIHAVMGALLSRSGLEEALLKWSK